MTQHSQNGEGVEVIQSDRDQAWPFRCILFAVPTRERWNSGDLDKHWIIQSFARYRQSLAREPATADTTPPDELARIQLLADVELHLQSVRIFLTKREKMHPCGIDLHDELQARVTAAINEGKHNG